MSNMDRTHTLQSLTDDILQEVDANELQEKVASEQPRSVASPLASKMLDLSLSLKKIASDNPEITYNDLREFQNKMRSRS